MLAEAVPAREPAHPRYLARERTIRQPARPVARLEPRDCQGMTEIGSEPRSHEEELRRRLRELGAVHRIVEAVVVAEHLDAVLDEAVDALMEAVTLDRAAVLLHDELGVMRFRAWRGLSTTYRTAAEGHSPWSADQEEFVPVAVPDALEEPAFAEELRGP